MRGIIGWSFPTGEDPPSDCQYYGLDVGHTFCGCWGIDAFYRTHEGQFDRDPDGKDGGRIHHFGLKGTYEASLGGRWYGWAGLGAEYFTTTDYLDDDSGWGLFGEAGLGYLITRDVRVRAGVNLHADFTDATRQDPADDGDERWNFFFAPMVALEVDF